MMCKKNMQINEIAMKEMMKNEAKAGPHQQQQQMAEEDDEEEQMRLAMEASMNYSSVAD